MKSVYYFTMSYSGGLLRTAAWIRGEFQLFGYTIAEMSNPDKIFCLAVGLTYFEGGGKNHTLSRSWGN